MVFPIQSAGCAPTSNAPTAPPLRVATAGEALFDLIEEPDGRLKPCAGGAVYNLTRALGLQGVGTLYLNPLSGDMLGRQLARGLHDAGVALAAPTPVRAPSALALAALWFGPGPAAGWRQWQAPQPQPPNLDDVQAAALRFNPAAGAAYPQVLERPLLNPARRPQASASAGPAAAPPRRAGAAVAPADGSRTPRSPPGSRGPRRSAARTAPGGAARWCRPRA